VTLLPGDGPAFRGLRLFRCDPLSDPRLRRSAPFVRRFRRRLRRGPCRTLTGPPHGDAMPPDDRVWGSPGLQGRQGLPAPAPLLSRRSESAAEAANSPYRCCADTLSSIRAGTWFAPCARIRQVPPARGRSGRFAAPWPFTAALRDLGARRRAAVFEDGALADPRPVGLPALSSWFARPS